MTYMVEISKEFAEKTIKVMEDNNAWFVSQLISLKRKSEEASIELEQHRQSMRDREIILATLKELTE